MWYVYGGTEFWFKVDDGFANSKPVLRIPRRYRLQAVGLWALAGTWSAKQNTYGRVPDYVLPELGGSSVLAAHLTESGLWKAIEGGWQFVEWRKTQDGDYRRNIRAGVRQEVMKRDGYACVDCGTGENLSLDHIQRYRDDGPDTVENLRVLCMPCNQVRG
jgi:hypothetical protein